MPMVMNYLNDRRNNKEKLKNVEIYIREKNVILGSGAK